MATNGLPVRADLGVDGVRQQLFAGADFAQQQHGAVLTGGGRARFELLHGARYFDTHGI